MGFCMSDEIAVLFFIISVFLSFFSLFLYFFLYFFLFLFLSFSISFFISFFLSFFLSFFISPSCPHKTIVVLAKMKLTRSQNSQNLYVHAGTRTL